ncbi:hypothetical protein [Streptomyces sp. JB150]|uniref:hypothetical protein n=1 Tax=Streptomyces sp. JB150 TaxID=2714844 RepID=UPI00140CA690|nr:hypothetical protein [Streptomyces sp. JB150]QIJ66007.1 hypothetical protein G7Z13_31340 [Streptomyces sp. JB150]
MNGNDEGAVPSPEAGSVRLADDGTLEQFDGTAWTPYEELVDDGEGQGPWDFRRPT